MTNGGDSYDDMMDTHGCSRAGWYFAQVVVALAWLAVACLALWLLAKLGWEVGRWIGS